MFPSRSIYGNTSDHPGAKPQKVVHSHHMLAATSSHYEAASAGKHYYSAVHPASTVATSTSRVSTTPVRSTTPSNRCATPVRPTKSTTSSLGSAFMTQAARNDSTPRAQVITRPLSAHAHTAPIRRGPTLLPPTALDRRMLLVLDMDETLLHADVSPVPHDVSFVVTMDSGHSTPVYVKFRPHLGRFLNAVSRLFEVAVFTASISRYANQVLDYIDPTGELVHHRLFREHCTEVNGTYVKDLAKLGRPLERVAIVDNSPLAYSWHPENAVAIPSWYDCDRDIALQQLVPHLERMSRGDVVYDSLDDIRRVLQWD